jgi:hypothetical protein
MAGVDKLRKTGAVFGCSITVRVPGMLRGCTGSLDMLGWEEMKSPTSWQEANLLYSLLDLSRPWEFLGRI